MSESKMPSFADGGLHAWLEQRDATSLDGLDFGVIGFDRDLLVCRYNSVESRLAGLGPDRVLGHALFEVVAPCMNNFMVAQRFADAEAAAEVLDDAIAYVLTLRMRPEKVRLRLLADPALATRYVLVERHR